MTSLAGTLAWCVVQVGILAGLGVAAAWALRRRSPAAAATAAAAAAGMAVLVTLLAPVRLPRLVDRLSAGAEARPQATGREDEAPVSAMEADGPALSMLELVNGAAALMGATELGGAGTGTRGWAVATIMAAGAALGCWRFLAAWRYMAGLRRGAVPVECGATKREFVELASALGIRRHVALCESPQVAGPAVIGWRRPTVLLPVARSTWSAEQLRAALAHELAHVARGDFFWRVTAAVTQAIHFYHPLVHWLTRRLALAQELAADRLAAAASGGAGAYVRALSELAIRLDEQPRLRAAPLVLPTFNSNLIRRITMLRSKEGMSWKGGKQFGGAVAAAAIVLVGVGTTVLRSSAEAVQESTAAAGVAASMFERPPVDPTILGGTEKGLLVVRLGELAQRPAFVPVVGLLNALCQQHWEIMFGAPGPDINFDAVEFVAGVPAVTIGPIPEEQKAMMPPDATGRLMIGGDEFVVRFKHEVDWQAWVQKYMPLAERRMAEGLTYVELPPIPALGPGKLLVSARDSRTLVITSGDVTRVRKLAATPQVELSAREVGEWRALDGGLVTIIANGDRIDRALPTPKAPAAATVLRDLKRFGVAFDLDAATNEAGLRLDLACGDAAAAERARTAFAELLPLATQIIEAEIKNPTQRRLDEAERKKWKQTAGDETTDRRVAEFWLEVIKSCAVRVESHDDGTARVRLASTAAFPAHIVTAYEVAEKADATKAKTK